ncbi:hypothetical protein CVU82_04195 [Candidatus Falkowbacteria bacterium HGW-Falkowbacteria-1]|jgi:ribosomal protein L7Ae-like RNA K-turn-binding protein|uniref:DAGKc domain-containing protein n=1 Tax=Candidatus Falkowbacteria bacterium HGW-Falkowbacteria-1 TaxID=2013768 RepID=A0A2N2E910_9BACT|nr:MAG: hypothetical protein CVU82_04195 [Candidatus Falkowbacteria bacterium HGW-Falkowbacteria-1]
MNVFIYDAITEKYKKKTRRFEEQINKLNLQGKIIYLKNIKNTQESIEKEINNGAKTIIIVGNDQTVSNIINIFANISENIPIFVVPIGNRNNIANSLGVKNEKEAAFTLSARRIETIKIAKINDLYFLSNCYIKNKGTTLKINSSYSLNFNNNGYCYIFNLLDRKCSTQNISISPQDNILNLYTETNSKDKTLLPIKEEVTLNNEDALILVDNSKEIECPAKIMLTNKVLSFIVGKERTF